MITQAAALGWMLLASAPAGGEHGTSGGHSATPELPNIITLVFGHDHWAAHWMNVIFAYAIMVILCVIAVRAYKHRELIPGPFQNVVEWVVESLDNFFGGILGKDSRTFLPFLGTLFVYIFLMNIFALFPGMMSPPGGPYGINTTIALAVCVFGYVQYTGIKRLGLMGYLDHLAGEPRDFIGWCLVPLNLPIHISGELIKPVSLSLRLFGNITGEDVLLAVFVGLGLSALSFMHSPVGLPLHLPFIFLALVVSFIQALVFTLLSSIYFLMMLPHHEEEHAH
jgi:F-type H+-transporting ATPase subunit a